MASDPHQRPPHSRNDRRRGSERDRAEDRNADQHVDQLVAGLNDRQREAVLSSAAPLRIIAGAGSGKTRVLTRRIARRAAEDEIDPRRVLTVTFTRKAAAELRSRLGQLGLRSGVTAGTFHSIAYAQLRQRWDERGVTPPTLLDRKVGFVARFVRSKSSTAALDVVSEIEWAKARLVTPDRYAWEAQRANRRPPFDLDVVASLYDRYEQEKLKAMKVDFDDLLRLATRDIHADPAYGAARRHLFRHLFVDEFQDVNPLQFGLLQAWLGDSPDLCVVGDPNQAIYAWNGADSSYLTDFDDLFPTAETVTLDQNYRSSPQILGVANVVLASGAHTRLELRATRPDGPLPTVTAYPDEVAEARAIARRARDAHAPGDRWSDQAVLVRTNAQLASIAEAFAAAHLPFRTRGGAKLLDQPEVKDAIRSLRRALDLTTALTDLELTLRTPEGTDGPTGNSTGTGTSGETDGADDREAAALTDERAANLAELVRLGNEYLTLDPTGSPGTFEAWLISALRDGDASDSDAVDLTTFHAAKGLEWGIVHLAGIEEGFVPIRYATTAEAEAEELRLLYVAVTRAERALHLSRAQKRSFGTRQSNRRPSPYLTTVELALELMSDGAQPTDLRSAVASARATLADRAASAGTGRGATARSGRGAGAASELTADQQAVLDRLKRWRLDHARAANVPAYVIFNDATLIELAAAAPRSDRELLEVSGVGPVKAQRFGPELLELISGG